MRENEGVEVRLSKIFGNGMLDQKSSSLELEFTDPDGAIQRFHGTLYEVWRTKHHFMGCRLVSSDKRVMLEIRNKIGVQTAFLHQ